MISANGLEAVLFKGSRYCEVRGNVIGSDGSGTLNLGDGSDGVSAQAWASDPSTDNIIGGTAAGAGNLIANNSGNGVVVSD